ncbi:hypothetical protein BCV69DRAFT_283828 [Microstroma glucosiphilum]|uniref:(S)-ureidoglycine aminohydrolase cupin domain-containing protein n=1 Tax=Pseudomicrostroma glucosiphilum TaxID=1684307 RepID=A0A316U5V8_9BASI|nr:hypothetical protein BCV69DRAFT_283828 [Pseudomicrostroma glucosiphilum]PWN19723.1 hypothetical protein BCV69DRAFT_283828 [Pseudomicrostroma glucosiphilum]
MPGIALLTNAAANCKLDDVTCGGFLGDIATSANSTLTAGIYHQTKNTEEEALKFKYKYDEFKLIIEGTICIKEPSTGTQIEAKVGDVVNISKGADLVFWSPEGGKAYFVGNRGVGEL